MPITPNTAIFAQQPPVPLMDPLQRYGQFLGAQGAMTQNALAANNLNIAKGLNQAYAMPGAINPDGSLNMGVIGPSLVKSGAGSAIPKAEIANLGMQKTIADTSQAKVKSLTPLIQHVQDQLGPIFAAAQNIKSPADYQSLAQEAVAWQQNYSQPALGQVYSLTMSPPQVQAALAQDQKTLHDAISSGHLPDYLRSEFLGMNAVKNGRTVMVNQGNQITPLTPRAYGGAGGQPTTVSPMPVAPKPGELLASQTALKVAQIKGEFGIQEADITQGGAMARVKVASAYKSLMSLYPSALQAPVTIANANLILKDLDSGHIYTGASAEAHLKWSQAIKVLTNGQINPQGIPNTQILAKELASNMLALAGSLRGAKIAGPELSFLRSASANSITLDSSALRRIVNIYKQIAQFQVNSYRTTQAAWSSIVGNNTQLPQLPPLKNATTFNTLPGVTPGKPSISLTPSPASIDHLKANPSLAAQFDQHYGSGSAEKVLGK